MKEGQNMNIKKVKLLENQLNIFQMEIELNMNLLMAIEKEKQLNFIQMGIELNLNILKV